jgi:poly-gamma-glutamate capsule biosynthesis protein CapA/YwtB (metallophosphatase superfamily)
MAMAPAPDAGSSFFSGVRADLTGDLVFGNLEGTLATDGQSKCGPSSTNCFAFRAPPSYAQVLKRAGFSLLNLANNHALDYGSIGQSETVAALDRASLRHTGRPHEVAYVHARGVTIAVLGFAPYPWAQSLTDIPAAQRLVGRAAEAADLVVVTMHAGAEGSDHQHVQPGTETYLGENRGNAVAFSHAVIDAGADLVVGSGPHVLRGLEWYHGRLIAYSLGNFLGYGTLGLDGPTGISAVLKVALRSDGSWASGRIVPLRLIKPGLPADDAGAAAASLVRTLSDADFGKRAMRVSATGVLAPPR